MSKIVIQTQNRSKSQQTSEGKIYFFRVKLVPNLFSASLLIHGWNGVNNGGNSILFELQCNCFPLLLVFRVWKKFFSQKNIPKNCTCFIDCPAYGGLADAKHSRQINLWSTSKKCIWVLLSNVRLVQLPYDVVNFLLTEEQQVSAILHTLLVSFWRTWKSIHDQIEPCPLSTG